MAEVITVTFFSILAAGFLVGIVVGLTGMGGGALMTPALIFLGHGDLSGVTARASRVSLLTHVDFAKPPTTTSTSWSSRAALAAAAALPRPLRVHDVMRGRRRRSAACRGSHQGEPALRGQALAAPRSAPGPCGLLGQGLVRRVRSSSPSRARAATTSSTQSSIDRPVVSTRTAASSGSS